VLVLTRAALRAPRLTAALVLAASLALGAGLLRLRTDAGFRAYVGADHPTVRRFDDFLSRFGGGLPIAAVWSCKETRACRDVFDERALAMAHTVALALQTTPGVRAVASPATAPLLVPTPEGFAVRRLVEEGRPVSDRERLRRRAVADPLWVGSLVSADADVGALVIELASSDSQTSVSVLRALQESLAPWEARGFEFNLVGDPVEFVIAGGDLERDSRRLVPVIVALIGALILALFRDPRTAAASLVTVGVAVLWSAGLMGWLGWPQTAVTQALAPFIVVVGICNAIHLVARYASELGAARDGRGGSREAAMLAVVRDIGGPCFIASATTAGGFASFATSGALSFLHFGVISAFGVMAALALCFSLLPVWLVRIPLLPGSVAAAGVVWGRALELVVDAAQRRYRLVLLATLVLCGFALVGLSRLRVEVDVYHLFGEETRVVRWIRFVEERLRKPDTLDVVLTLPEGRALEEPAVLEDLGRLARSLAELPGLGQTRSVLVPMSRLNRLLHQDDPIFERPAATAAGNAELLFLLSLDEPQALDRWVSLDRRSVRIEVEVRAGTHSYGEDLLRHVQALLASDFLRAYGTELNGPVKVFVQMVEEVQTTQLTSFATAFLVVAGLVAVFLRSLAWSFAAMLPTSFPVLVTLGVMGHAGVYLDMGTAMIAAVVLGIAIDDTVHLLTQYRRRLAVGSTPVQAIRAAVLHVGRAVVTTSLALSLGFFVLTLSSWESVASFGFLSGIAILIALVADLVILPAVIAAAAGYPRLRCVRSGARPEAG
jgi:predicted RND superfamily exporter protein